MLMSAAVIVGLIVGSTIIKNNVYSECENFGQTVVGEWRLTCVRKEKP